MSLDVYLKVKGQKLQAVGSDIFIREDGRTREISRTEWDARFPDREPIVVVAKEHDDGVVYDANITHNLGRMAEEAGIYEVLWRPEEIGTTRAEQLIVPLRDGLALLQSNSARFKKLNPENGWGNYEGLVDFVAGYLSACMTYPDAIVSVSR